MAAGKSVIAMARNADPALENGICFVEDSPAFIAACRSAMCGTPEHRRRRMQRQNALLEALSWDAAVARVVAEIDAATAFALTPGARIYLSKLRPAVAGA